MHFRNVLIPGILLFLCASCQKGIDFGSQPGNGTGGSGTSGNVAVKVEAFSAKDTFISNYYYDSLKQLSGEKMKGTASGIALDIFKKYYRDAKGRIIKIAELNIQTSSILTDTVFTYVYYPDTTSKKFTHRIRQNDVFGFIFRDSTVSNFNASGNVILETTYSSNSFIPGVTLITQKIDYSYANGNVAQQNIYVDTAGTGTLSLYNNVKYSYDGYVNPLITNEEAFLMDKISCASKNNVVRMELTDISMPSNNLTITTVIMYGAGNKISTATSTQMPGNVISKSFVYYQ